MKEIKFEDFQRNYKFERELSRGSFGRVSRIREIKSGRLYALKKLVVKSHKELDDALNEIEILNRFQHPAVIAIHEYYNIQIIKGYGKTESEIGILMEYAQASLEAMIHNKSCIGTWSVLLRQASFMIQVLALLQKQNIAHRDIKPGNILVFEAEEGCYKWKLADFGLAIDLNKNKVADKFAGSFEYASPALRKKFKFNNLRIQTNPFKDDVYSLGITLLEIATGFRKYVSDAKRVLEEVCTNDLLRKIIDIMLEEDEERRPCFKQLMMILQEEGFQFDKEVSSDSNSLTKKKTSLSHMEKLVEARHHQVPARTMQKNKLVKTEVEIIETKKGVMSMSIFDGQVMCGCEDGSILIVSGKRLVNVGKIHKKYVSALSMDEKGNIWSGGGDRSILIWNSHSLLKALKNSDFTILQEKKKNIFKRPKDWKTQTEIMLNMSDNQKYKQISLPFDHQGGISTIQCLDEEHFAVGFFDGFVFIQWGVEEFHKKLHSGPVTTLKFTNDRSLLYSSGYDGSAKAVKIDSMEIHNKFYNDSQRPIVSMQFTDMGLALFTLNGDVTCINREMNSLYSSRIPIQNIMTGVGTAETILFTSEGGEIMNLNEERLGNLGSRGWNTMGLRGPRQLAVGSLDGKVALISW